MPEPLRKVQQANRRAQRSYAPRVYTGRVTIFRTSEQAVRASLDPRLDWAKLTTAGLEDHLVPGHHRNMWREPHVQVTLEKFQDCLRRAHSEMAALKTRH